MNYQLGAGSSDRKSRLFLSHFRSLKAKPLLLNYKWIDPKKNLTKKKLKEVGHRNFTFSHKQKKRKIVEKLFCNTSHVTQSPDQK